MMGLVGLDAICSIYDWEYDMLKYFRMGMSGMMSLMLLMLLLVLLFVIWMYLSLNVQIYICRLRLRQYVIRLIIVAYLLLGVTWIAKSASSSVISRELYLMKDFRVLPNG